MEQIRQLKEMRDSALERLQANPDFKLVNSLDQLIGDLEEVVAAAQPAEIPAFIDSNTDTDSNEEGKDTISEAANIDLEHETPTSESEKDDGAGLDDALMGESDLPSDEEIATLAATDADAAASTIDALEAELSVSLSRETPNSGSIN